jgi:hypothetical protein
MTIVDNLPVITARIDGQAVLVPFVPEGDGAPVTRAITNLGVPVMVCDTGAAVSVVRRSRALFEDASVTGTMHTSRRFVLGGEDFEDFGPLELRLLDYAEPEGTDGFIGHSFFARHVVCVDFQRKAFVVRRQ